MVVTMALHIIWIFSKKGTCTSRRADSIEYICTAECINAEPMKPSEMRSEFFEKGLQVFIAVVVALLVWRRRESNVRISPNECLPIPWPIPTERHLYMVPKCCLMDGDMSEST